MKNTHFYLLLFLFAIGCSNPLEDAVLGNWTASSITEEGKSLDVNTGEVKLNLRENGQYEYYSTLNYKESGSWFLDENLLFTNDTIHKAGQKAVLILETKPDTIVLKMVENGKERLLTLAKE
jgi:hypothetical protein